MRLNAIIPCLGMVVFSIAPIFGGNWNTLAPVSPLTDFYAANRATAFFEKNIGREAVDLSGPAVLAVGVTATSVVNSPCNNAPNGSITVTATGATGTTMTFQLGGVNYAGTAVNIGPFTENPTDFARTFNGLRAGNYNVTVTANNGTSTVSGIIVQHPPSAQTPITVATSPSCAGGNNGSISITQNFNSATAPYQNLAVVSSVTFTLTSGPGIPPSVVNADMSSPFSANFGSLSPGTYSASVQINGCNVNTITGIVVTNPSPVVAGPATNTPVSCFGGMNGTATFSATGGTGSYSFNIGSGAQPSGAFTGLAAGPYTCTITDGGGCTATASTTVGTPTAMVAGSPSSTPVSCFGGMNGTATFSVTGGTPGYSFNIGTGVQTDNSTPYQQTFNGLATGTYTCTITDGNGCTRTSAIMVGTPTMMVLSATQINVSCFGGSNGSIDLTVSGGSPGYTYDWSNDGAEPIDNDPQDLTGLAAGTYTVTVTDANNCTKTTSVTITQPTVLTASSTFTQPLCNGGSTGTVTVSATGGTAPYTGTVTYSGLSAGAYSYTVTDDKGCTSVTTGTITQPSAVAVTGLTFTNETCAELDNGSIAATIGGGTPNYSVEFDGPSFSVTVSNYAPGTFTSGPMLAAGTYEFTVTDDNGCSTTGSQLITEPDPLTVTSSHTDLLCNGDESGTITLNASGGTKTYNYDLGNGETDFDPAMSASETLTGLDAGTYNITVSDANGCSADVVVTEVVDEPDPLEMAVVNVFPPTCAGSGDGAFEFTLTGGVPAYDADLLRDGVFFFNGTLAVTPPNWFAIGLDEALWSVELTDGNGCTATISQQITDPEPVEELSSTIENVSCNGLSDGSIYVAGMGGTGDYSFSIAPDNGDSPTPDGADHTFSGLSAGTYSITITDDNGCTGIVSHEVTEPDVLELSLDSQLDVTCFGAATGNIVVSGTGGTVAYSFELDGDDYNMVPIMPITNGDGSFTQLNAGTYSVTLTDANGCTDAAGPITINQPDELYIDFITLDNPTCFGDFDASVDVFPVGGTPFPSGSYSFYMTGTLFNGNQIFPIFNNTGTFTGLTNGTYTAVVIDANGCSATYDFDILLPEELVIDAFVVTDVSCFGGNDGAITINAINGGTPPLTFLWSPNGETTEDISGLLPGEYNVVVTDDNGCTATFDPAITITEPAAWSVVLEETTPVSCFGGNDGALTATISGPGLDPNYLYTLTGPTGSSFGFDPAVSHLFENLEAGNYSIEIENGSGCTVSATATLTQPDPLAIIFPDVNDVTCPGGDNGSIFFRICGGTNDEDSPYIVTLCDDLGDPIDTYEVTGDCSLGQAVRTFTDAATTEPLFAFPTNPNRIDQRGFDPMRFRMRSLNNPTGDVVLEFMVPAGYAQVRLRGTYLAANPSNEPLLYSVDGGTFVSMSDPNGGPFQFIRQFIDVDPMGGTVVRVKLSSFAPGVATFNLRIAAFETGFASLTITDLEPGDYTVKVTDANGCTGPFSMFDFTINEPAPIDLTIYDLTNVSCNGGSDGEIDMMPAGGTAPYTYEWSNGPTVNPNSGLVAGEYFVTVTDANGCTATNDLPFPDGIAIEITEPDPLDPGFTYLLPTCFGDNNGEIYTNTIGGTPGYSYLWANDGETTDFLDTKPAGDYVVTITDDNGCTMEFTATLGQPDLLVANLDNSTDLACHDTDDGEIYGSAIGGTLAYTFFLGGIDDDMQVYTAGPQAAGDFTGLEGGLYTLGVMDANGCTAEYAGIEIINPDVLDANSSQPLFSCQGGEVLVTPLGGTAPYTIQMVDCDDNSPIGPAFTVAENYNFTELGAGEFCWEIDDANGCGFAYASATILATDIEPDVFITAVSAPAGCAGVSSGSISATATGGSSDGFDFDLYDGDGLFVATMQDAAAPFTANFGSLPAGDYDVVATDLSFGCSVTTSVTVIEPDEISVDVTYMDMLLCNGGTTDVSFTVSGGTAPYSGNETVELPAGTYNLTIEDANGCQVITGITITEPGPIDAFASSVTQINCNGAANGSATITATGGIAPYEYSLDNGATYQASNIFEDLDAADYVAVVKDANGCTYAFDVYITEPDAIAATVEAAGVTCNGETDGSAVVSASGGSGDLEYSIDGGATYQLDDNLFTGLAPGTYSVIVRDENGCTFETATFTIGEPDALVASSVSTAILCMGGSATVTVSATGGTAPYTGTGTFSVVADTYTYHVSDDNGCSASTTIEVTGPTMIAISLSAINGAGCAQNGSVTAAVSGGTPNMAAPFYGYMWFNNATLTGNSFGSTATINPPSGNYWVKVTDANGCTKSAGPISVTQPVLVAATATSTPADCSGAANGTIFVSASGGTSPYFYSKNGGTTFQTGATFGNLIAGNYNVVVRDDNGCTFSVGTVTVSQPSAISATATIQPAGCNGAANGSFTLSATGGTPAYLYSKNGGTIFQPSPTFAGLAAGNYSVVVRDDNGCTFSMTVVVPVATGPTVMASAGTILCNGGTATVTLTVTGGLAPYSNSGPFTRPAGTHIFTVTDANGCSGSASVTIAEPTVLAASSGATAILCNGGNSTVTVSATGGTAPYTGTGTFTRPAGTHTFNVTDANGCTKTTSVTISQPTALTAASTATAILCNGGSSTVTVSATGGTAPYTGTGTVSEVAGTYTYIVFDANGCSASTTITVSQPSVLVAASNFTPILCNGGSSTVTVSATGGTAPYSGTGNFPQTAGTQTYTVTDANGCSKTVVVNISQPAALSASASATAILCNGGNSTVTVSAAGGTAPYTGTGTFTRPAGTHTFNVTDANGCATTTSVTISQPTALTAASTATAILCNGGSSTVTISATGGTAPYTGTGTVSAVAGTYTYSVTDANGCSASTSITISQPSLLVASSNFTPILCNGGSSTVTVSATGGTAPYSGTGNFPQTAGTQTYTVTDANGCSKTVVVNISQPAALSASASATAILCMGGSSTVTVSATGGTAPYTGTGTFTRPAGTYNFTVTDANGCSTAASVTITQPTMLALTETHVNSTCGMANGSIDLSVSGGTPNQTAPFYTYSWSNLATTQDVSGLTPGNYTVIVTDANGCTKSLLVNIGSTSGVNLTATATNAACFGGNGSISATASNGTPAYTYAIGNSTNNSGQFAGLPAGTYSVLVTDANGCTATASATVGQPAQLVLGAAQTNVSCFGGSNGTITVSATGGTAAYSFNWGNQSGTGPNPRTGLAAGTYTVTVTDANGCTGTTSATITQPALLVVNSAPANVSCFGGSNGSITVSATGGTQAYSFNWGSQSGTGPNPRTGLAAGTYTVTVTDANGCTGTASATVGQPTLLVVNSTSTNVSCNGGSNGTITVSATGGTTAYSFNWGGGIVSQNRTGLAAGTYTVTVTDANGCTGTTSATITQPAALSVSLTQTNVSCNGGSNGTITVSATGGTTAYSFNWGGGIVSQNRTGLAAGTYTVTVTDANGCTGTASATVTQPAPLSANATTSGGQCGANTGFITVSPTGGTPSYNYVISNGNGGQVSAGATTGQSGGATVGPVPPGQYSVAITDANGCTAVASVTVGQPAVTVSMAMTNVSCFGGNNGSISLTTLTGASPFSYNWSPAQPNSPNLTGLAAGSYAVTVTDANQCSLVKTTSLSQPNVLVLTETHVNASCGNPNGSITLAATGGVSPYSFSLNGGTAQASGSFPGLAANTYNAVVTDANGCSKNLSIAIVQGGSPVQIGTQVVNVACFGGSTGSITATATGGTAPYMYRIGTGAFGTNNSFPNLAAGSYQIEAKDANGCTTIVQVSVSQPASALAATATGSPALCNGASNGTITVTATGGTTAYQYKIGNGSFGANNVFGTLAAGTYVIVVRDANGCETSVQATVQQPAPLAVSTVVVNVTCNGGSDGKITVTATGATPAYSYSKNGGAFQTGNQFTGLTAGTYTIVVKDANSCTASTTATVGQPAAGPLAIVLNEIKPVTCAGNGAILVTVSGCGPFMFLWTKPNGDPVGTGEDLINVPAGTYNLFVKDGGGMTAMLNGTVVPTAPPTIQNLVVENNTTCAVTLTWSATPNVDGYEIRYKTCQASAWTTIAAGNVTTYTVTGLNSLTCYNFEVRFRKDPCFGDWTPIVGGSTTPEFNPPVNPSATVNSNSSATIKWTQSNCGIQTPANVELRYRKVGVTTWTVITLSGTATNQTLNNLMANTCYEYRLRNRYVVSNVTKWSSFTPIKTFCLPTNLTGGNGNALLKPEDEAIKIEYEVAEDRDEAVEIPAATLDFILFPNPATDFVNLRFNTIDAANSLTIKLLSLSGQLISQQTILDPTGIADQQLEVNPLPQGFYLIEVSNGALRKVEKFVKQ